MKKENYETPKVEVVTLDVEGAMCDAVVSASIGVEDKYQNTKDYDESVWGSGSSTFSGRNF